MTNTSDSTHKAGPIIYYKPGCAEAANALGDVCTLEAAPSPPQALRTYAGWLDKGGLALIPPVAASDHGSLFRLDAAALPDALIPGRSRASLLLRACAATRDMTILDPFAGFALDALQLSQAGCQVHAVERQPLVYAMARDLAGQLLLPLTLQCADALQVLAQPGQSYDVVYLDPMFPRRNKKALPGLAMQHLRNLTADVDGTELEIDPLLDLARRCARQRVVLKRRLKDPVSGKPQFQLKGQKIRFDVYA